MAPKTVSYSGRDEATGFSFRISVSPPKKSDQLSVDGHALYVDLKCYFSLHKQDSVTPYSYHDMARWGPRDLDRVLLSTWLDRQGIPLTAREDTLRIVFDYVSSGEAVDGVIVNIGMHYVPARDLEASERERSYDVCSERFSLGFEAIKDAVFACFPCSVSH